MQKKTFIITLFLLGSLFVDAQDFSRHEINLSPLQIFDGSYKAGYEYYLNQDMAITSYVALQSLEDDYSEVWGVSGEVQYRYYFSIEENSFYKFYTSPYFMYKYRHEKYADHKLNSLKQYKTQTEKEYANFESYNGGMMSGIKLYLNYNITFDFSIGGGYKASNSTGNAVDNHPDNGIFSIDYSGLVPRANISIGMKF